MAGGTKVALASLVGVRVPSSIEVVQVIDVIEDATTDLAIFWSGAVRPVLFQRASAKADDWCRLLRS